MKGLNYKIEPIDDNRYKIDARVTRKGRTVRKRETVKGKRQAERRAQQIVLELEERAENEANSSERSLNNFGECIDFYLENCTIDLNNCYHPIKVLTKHLSNVSVDNIQHHYDKFIQKMRHKISYRKRQYTPATLNRFSQRIRAILNFCKKKKVIPKGVELEVSMFKEIPRTRILSDDELQRLLSVVKNHRERIFPLIMYALQVPSRKGELLKMRKEWVDISNRCIVIPPSEMKNDRQCIKPIPPNMIDYFKGIPDSSDYVFYWKEKDTYKPIKDFRGSWDYCLKVAEIDDFRFHDTRHHSATNLILKGVSERLVMQVAGWSTNMLSTYFNNTGLNASNSVIDALTPQGVQEGVQDNL